MNKDGTNQPVHRPATDQDIEDVYALYMDEASNPYLTYDPMDRKSFKPLFDQILTTQTLFVCELGSKIIGSYRLIQKEHRQSGTIYIGGFVIHSDRKGKGLGKVMMEHIIRKTTRMGIRRLELTVDIENKAAIRLYEHCGFTIEGRIRDSYKSSQTNRFYDEYLMGLIFKC